jgi:PAS domain S-box-containing protein
MLGKDRSEKDILQRAYSMKDKEGKVIGLVGIHTDITARKRIEEALRESEAKYRAFFASAAEGIAAADSETKQFRYVNPAMCRMFGYTEEELTRLGVADIHPKESLGHVQAEFEAQLRSRKTLASYLPCLRKDGALFYANVSAAPIILNGHKCLVGFFTDTTERKKAEEELRAEKNKLEKYFNAAGAIILFLSLDGKVLLMNKIGCETLGYERSDILNKNWVDKFILEKDRIKVAAIFDSIIREKKDEIKYFETILLTKNKKHITVSWGSVMVKDESDKIQASLNIGINTTELAEAKITIDDLNKINRLKDDFLNISAHELKTPLTSIIGFSEIIKEQNIFSNPEQEKYINIIHEESVKLADIVRRILLITRFESGREVIIFKPVNLSNFISSFLIKLNVIASKGKSKVVAQIEEENIIISTNEEKISEVIYNFIDNALKYGQDEQTIVLSLTRPNKEWVRVAVKNQGKGIPQEKLDQLFNKFSQLEPSFIRSQEGTGLGLYICKIVVNSLGGKIGVESEPDKGATFYFDLPVKNTAVKEANSDLKAV